MDLANIDNYIFQKIIYEKYNDLNKIKEDIESMLKEYEKLLKIKSKYDFIDDYFSKFFKHHFIDYENCIKNGKKKNLIKL